METTVNRTHESRVQANVLSKFAHEQCSRQLVEEPTRRNNILDVFITNNDQLTLQN